MYLFQLRIVGVELDTPAHHELRSGKIKLLDIITQLNEEDIGSGEWFRQSTRDKTKPLLTLIRNHKIPSITSLLSRGRHSVVHSKLMICLLLTSHTVKDKCKLATHVRVLINPHDVRIQSGTKDFGFYPCGKVTMIKYSMLLP